MRLSRLQRVILQLGLKNSEKERGHIPKRFKANVAPAEVKVAYYNFPLRPKGRMVFFDKSEVGHARYNSASVAIAHAFDRLAKKGLAERLYGRGIRLTEKGQEVAAQIRND